MFVCLGCRRVTHPSNPNRDYCLYVVNVVERPLNKSQASSNEVVGGGVVGSTGAVAATQVGMCLLTIFIHIFFF
jgi:hypothetical protein